MELDNHINELPLSKSRPETLKRLFGFTDLDPMWIADMDFQIAQPIQDALKDRITNSGFGYEFKPESFFAAQQRWYKNEYDLKLERAHVLYTPSITTSIAVALEHYTKPGDGVLIQPPVFMEFRDVIRKTKRKVVKNPLILNKQRYTIDFDDLEAKASLGQTKVLILCNPHNPVGRVWDKKTLERIIDICAQHDLLLISDEIHKDIILQDHCFTSALHYADQLEHLVVCTSEAKTFNLAGISDSMTIIPNTDFRTKMQQTLGKYNLGATNNLTRVALEVAYNKGKPWLVSLLNTVQANVNIIEDELQKSRIKLIKPEGTYQVWLDFREVFNDSKQMFAHITKHSKVALNAGHWFGREGALFMRMNIATSHTKVTAAIKKVKVALP